MKILITGLVVFLSLVSVYPEKSSAQQTANEKDYLAELKTELKLKWPNNRTVNVVFHGHSVPSGYFKAGRVNSLAAYPHLFLKFLTENYHYAVINCITTSIGGEQAEQGAKRFKNDVLCLKPDLLFIDYALNDRSIGLERAEVAWRSMIKEALDADIKLVLLTPTPDLKEDILDENSPLAGYAKMIKKLGKENHIPVIDVYSQFKKLKKDGKDLAEYMSQNNHPNELGHQVAAQEIIKELFSEL
ncbi:SGNH/GDSL hydrolase family protein [Maribellus sediminis]|uniref:SGNH/GDSL hydrolase family protein n=1 Tax=Maribellus sediminis TaxID=2696285 RepID=UPI001431CD11|nr:GDSL-type esterase/lipase family protein [Maribellus sediminis]